MLPSCTPQSVWDVSVFALRWCLQMSGPVRRGQCDSRKERLADPGGWSPIDGVAMGTGVSARCLKRRVCVWGRMGGNTRVKQWLWVLQSHTNKGKHTPPAARWVYFLALVPLTVQRWVVSHNLPAFFVWEIDFVPFTPLVSASVCEPSLQTSCHIPSLSG